MDFPVKLSAVTAIIKDKKSRLLLLKRNELAYRGYWQFPEGKIDKNETQLQALKRELKEEIGAYGLSIKKYKSFESPLIHKGIPVLLKRQTYLVSFPSEIKLSSEHSEFGWFSKDEALKLKLVPGVKDIIENTT